MVLSFLSDNPLINFLYSYGRFILLYSSHVFLSFIFICCNRFSRMLEKSFIRFLLKTSICEYLIPKENPWRWQCICWKQYTTWSWTLSLTHTLGLFCCSRNYKKKVYVEKNIFPKWVIKQIFAQVKSINVTVTSFNTVASTEVKQSQNWTVTKHHIPYQRDKGIGLTKLLKISLTKYLLGTFYLITFACQKLNTYINVGEKFENKHDIIYFGTCLKHYWMNKFYCILLQPFW